MASIERIVLVAGLFQWWPVLLPAQADSVPPVRAGAPCSDTAYRQFDFWLGSWEVRNGRGVLVGHNEIIAVGGGCGLLENWRGARGGSGVSVSAYDPASGKWTQRWVGANALLALDGSLQDEAMVLKGPRRTTDSGPVLDRITWTPMPDGRVRQQWSMAAVGSDQWTVVFDGYYSRRRR